MFLLMTNLLFLFALLIFLGNKTYTRLENISLQESIDRKLIQVDIRGNANSPHYCQPIQLKV